MNDEYINMLNNVENHITITTMMNHCIEHYIHGRNMYSSMEEKEVLLDYIDTLMMDAVVDCLKDIIMNGVVIC